MSFEWQSVRWFGHGFCLAFEQRPETHLSSNEKVFRNIVFRKQTYSECAHCQSYYKRYVVANSKFARENSLRCICFISCDMTVKRAKKEESCR